MAVATSRLTTGEDLLAMPSGDVRRELVKGELTTMAPAGSEHGFLGGRLFLRMGVHAESEDLGVVFNSETGFYLAHEPDTVRAPDVAFVRKGRLPQPMPRGFFEGPPDIAVEVISPGDTLEAVDDKVGDYLDAGSEQVWVLNPKRRSLTVYHPDRSSKVLRETDMLDGGAAFPGFVLKIADIFK